ncbi:MAG: hypothetical protein MSF32_04320, partial [Dysosmobacter sp.]|nr:hypothetical protein [Dysosmobacter sp.]
METAGTASVPAVQLVEKPCLKEKSPFLQGEYEGETGEAPPAAEKASRFRGSGAIGGQEGAGNRKAATVP